MKIIKNAIQEMESHMSEDSITRSDEILAQEMNNIECKNIVQIILSYMNPEWKFMGMNPDGRWVAFTHRPKMGMTSWLLGGDTDEHQRIWMTNFDISDYVGNWRDSLVERL